MALFKKRKRSRKFPLLQPENIRIHQKAKTSDEAIVSIGNKLLDSGYILQPYIQGMLDRDHSLTTYLGNGIAIPHGEHEVQNYVLHTGIAVDIYPEGIEWQKEGTAQIVIGIAARTDEHIMILQYIAEHFGNKETAKKIVESDEKTIYELLMGKQKL